MENPKVDVIFGLHVDASLTTGFVGYKPGGFMASACDMKITVRGKGAHGAYPWSGIDPIVTSAEIINGLQTIVSRNLNLTQNAAVVTIGAISSGNRFNIIPESAEMLGTVRTLTDADQKMVFDRIKLVTTKIAESNGATAEVLLPFSVNYPVTFNDSTLVYRMLPSLQRASGISNCVLVNAKTGAEDFSFYQQKAPGFFFNLGAKPANAGPTNHHTPDFFIDEAGFVLGMKSFTNLVLDYMDMKH